MARVQTQSTTLATTIIFTEDPTSPFRGQKPNLATLRNSSVFVGIAARPPHAHEHEG
jgi:hypothetical protein